MKLKFATVTIHGTPRITFSRDEILAMRNSLDENDSHDDMIIQFLDALEKNLIESMREK